MKLSKYILRSFTPISRIKIHKNVQVKNYKPLSLSFASSKYFFTNFQNKHQQQYQTSSQKKPLPTFSQLQCKQLINEQNPLRDLILDHIDKLGQMKLQKYWTLALTDSQYGYYRQQNVFSKEGDFTTSPQISPLFGQMIAVWIVYFLTKVGIYDEKTHSVTKKFRLIEFGPGRGVLMRDIIKSLNQMKISNYFDISFVQVSEYNRKCQQDNIFQQFKKYDKFFKYQFESQNKQIESFKSQSQFQDINLKWFPNFQLIVKQDFDAIKNNEERPLTIFLMNQYFDALPTTIMQYTEKGWRQKVITKSMNPEMPLQIKNSSYQLPEKMRPTIKNPQIGDKIQVSHQSLLTIDAMAKLLTHTKGAILNIDYGAQHVFSDSIRGIKQHKFIPSPYLWQVPGKCDLSAYVNFQALADFAQNNPGVRAFEAIPQGYFLEAMGINPRIQILQKNMTKQQRQRIQSEYNRLVHPAQMGQNFKVQCITLKQHGQIYPWITQQEGVY